jgi:hypothetical protein
MRALSAALVLALVLPTVGLGQFLADVAAREKERRRKNQQTGVKARVVTDGDLAALPEEGTEEEAEETTTPAPETPPAPETSPNLEAGRKALEAAWRRRMKQARRAGVPPGWLR